MPLASVRLVLLGGHRYGDVATNADEEKTAVNIEAAPDPRPTIDRQSRLVAPAVNRAEVGGNVSSALAHRAGVRWSSSTSDSVHPLNGRARRTNGPPRGRAARGVEDAGPPRRGAASVADSLPLPYSPSAVRVRSMNMSETAVFAVDEDACSTSLPTGSPTSAKRRVETPASIRSITARVSGSRSAKYLESLDACIRGVKLALSELSKGEGEGPITAYSSMRSEILAFIEEEEAATG
jgi:hypothetical protein